MDRAPSLRTMVRSRSSSITSLCRFCGIRTPPDAAAVLMAIETDWSFSSSAANFAASWTLPCAAAIDITSRVMPAPVYCFGSALTLIPGACCVPLTGLATSAAARSAASRRSILALISVNCCCRLANSVNCSAVSVPPVVSIVARACTCSLIPAR